MSTFGARMLNQNPNRPGNANAIMVVDMSRSPEGYWLMTATWDGSDNPKPIFFGSDEMMTLTEAETQARDAMMAALLPDAPTEADIENRIENARKAAAKEAYAQARADARPVSLLGWLAFAISGLLFSVASLAALG